MAQERFEIKSGARKPALRVQITDPEGDPVDLTGLTVGFRMTRSHSRDTVIDGDATIVTAASGICEYGWAANDTDTPGSYLGEFRVSYGAEGQLIVPTGNYVQIEITKSIAAAP